MAEPNAAPRPAANASRDEAVARPARSADRLNPWLAVSFGGAVLGCILLLLWGFGLLNGAPAEHLQVTALVSGFVGLLLVLTVGPVVLAMRSGASARRLARMERAVTEMSEAFRSFNDQALLSDDARRVLNRASERELLCRTIEQDIADEDWDAGLVLCRELADRFGYRAEAEQYRARIELARSEVQERRVADSIAQLDGLIVQRRWDDAWREAARIHRLYPDSPRADRLQERVRQARAVYKTDLERRFLEAAREDNVDEAMRLLRELDAYLTEAEAEPLREVARGVIGKARENLGVKFKIAVQDHQWSIAAQVGRRIIAEFPNTRMAQEVRGVLDGILARANQSVPAAASAGTNGESAI